MMWPFRSVPKLGDTDMFVGFTDWHSHILPGVDDGMRTMAESLDTLREFERRGIRRVWLTPHIMEDCPNTTSRLRERFADLSEQYTGGIELRLASENMLDSLFEERLESNDFLPIGNEGSHLLVETSYVNPPFGMEEMIEVAYSKGYTVILAHPERYRYMEEPDYIRWKERGLLFQCNFVSLTGGYGETARKKMEWLLKNNMVNLIGSDLHRKFVFDHIIGKSPKSGSALRNVVEVAHNPCIQ